MGGRDAYQLLDFRFGEKELVSPGSFGEPFESFSRIIVRIALFDSDIEEVP
jgi:hypothetical protein